MVQVGTPHIGCLAFSFWAAISAAPILPEREVAPTSPWATDGCGSGGSASDISACRGHSADVDPQSLLQHGISGVNRASSVVGRLFNGWSDKGGAVGMSDDVAGSLADIRAELFCKTVTTVSDFSLEEYTRASWYVQEQQVLSYQMEDQLKCVVASYDVSGDTVDVYNWYEGGRPTANPDDTPITSTKLCARVTETPSKLTVAPCFLPALLSGDYWVVGLGRNDASGAYDWALISGGQPKNKFPDGCTTNKGPMAYFNAGLWIFSRTPQLSPTQLAAARATLKELGYTLSFLKPVRQGPTCNYTGAYIKP